MGLIIRIEIESEGITEKIFKVKLVGIGKFYAPTLLLSEPSC